MYDHIFKLIEDLFQSVLENIRPEQAYFDFVKGKALSTNGQHKKAIRHLVIAMKYHWHDPQTSIFLGKSLLALGHTQKAHEQFCYALEKAMELGMIVREDKSNGNNHELAENTLHDVTLSCIWIGNIASDLKDHTLANDALMAAFGNNPGSLKLYHWIGEGFASIKEYEMAILCYKSLIEKYPKDTHGHEQLANMIRMSRNKEDVGSV